MDLIYLFKNAFSFFLVILFSLMIQNCSKDPSSPTEEETPKNVVTIGIQGGTVEKNEFKLTIPSGAFDGDYDISVSEVENDGAFGENYISKTYKVNGIPNLYFKPIKIILKYNDKNSPDKKFLVKGDYILNYEDLTPGYKFLESIDSSGYLVSIISPPDNEFEQNKLKKENSIEILEHIYNVVTGYGTWLSRNHNFLIYYPINMDVEKSITLANNLEEAYEKLLDLGFSYEERVFWPIDVYFADLGDKDGIALRSKKGIQDGWLTFNLNSSDEGLRVTAGHEFFHLVQSFYDNRWISPRWASIKPNHYWLDEATAAWFEGKFNDNINYIPAVRAGNAQYPLEGMQKYPSNNPFNESDYWTMLGGKNVDDIVRAHGYGMSSMIKYLTNKYGENIIILMYNDILNGKNVVDAVCQYDPEEWWNDFLIKYLLNKTYNDMPYKDLNSITNGKNFQINSENDVAKSFTNSYQDLSGNLFYVRLNYPNISQNSQLSFKISGASNSYLNLFKFRTASSSSINQNELEYLNSDKNEVIIKDIRDLTNNHWQLYALVSNGKYSEPYTNTREINLNINVQVASNNLSEFNRCGFSLIFNGNIKRSDKDGIKEFNKDEDWNWYIYHAVGKFIGNTFKGDFNERSGEFIGSIEVTLNSTQDTVKNFVWNFEYSPDENLKKIYYASGVNIPYQILDITNYDYRFGIYNSDEVCNHLTKVEYNSSYIDPYTKTPITEELINKSCDNYSWISISFGKD